MDIDANFAKFWFGDQKYLTSQFPDQPFTPQTREKRTIQAAQTETILTLSKNLVSSLKVYVIREMRYILLHNKDTFGNQS